MKVIPASNSWFLQPKIYVQPRLRLFCFPYAGGAASAYFQWSNHVPDGVEVWPVQLPGRQNRLMELPISRISALVDAMLPAFQEHLDIPFAFFGHCMGAHLSFELVRQLRRLRAPLPEHLFVSARRAPQLSDLNTHCYHLSEPVFLKAVSNLNGLPKEFLENKELVRLMMPTLRADFEAAETYRYTDEEPLACPISVFGGIEDYSVTTDELMAWRNQTTGQFRYHLFPGDHFFIYSHQADVLKVVSGEILQLLEN
jgi:medium-chain acyl-[acyl-carrier-protein] hydrolase